MQWFREKFGPGQRSKVLLFFLLCGRYNWAAYKQCAGCLVIRVCAGSVWIVFGLFMCLHCHLFMPCISSPHHLTVFLYTHSSDPDKRSHPLLIRLRLFFMEQQGETGSGFIPPVPLNLSQILNFINVLQLKMFMKKFPLNSSFLQNFRRRVSSTHLRVWPKIRREIIIALIHFGFISR